MVPEIHYQLIASRVDELHREAKDHRRASQAASAKKERERGSQQRVRAAFAKLRTS